MFRRTVAYFSLELSKEKIKVINNSKIRIFDDHLKQYGNVAISLSRWSTREAFLLLFTD